MRDSYLVLGLAALLAVACGDLEAEGEPMDLDANMMQPPVGPGDAGTDAAVPVARELNTTSMTEWVYLDLETGETRSAASDPTDWTVWDLKAQRFKLATNGGASGAGKVKVSVVTNASFDAVSKAPMTGYAADPVDGSDTDLEPDYVLSVGDYGWYAYNETTHALTPKPLVYVVNTQEGAFFKFAVDGYYNAAGSSGYLQLRWAKISPPDGAITERDPNAAKPDAGVDSMTGASTR
jgi:hypothetical protein